MWLAEGGGEGSAGDEEQQRGEGVAEEGDVGRQEGDEDGEEAEGGDEEGPLREDDYLVTEETREEEGSGTPYDGGEECEDGDCGRGAIGLALDEVGGEAEDDEDEGELRGILSVMNSCAFW